MRTRPVCTLCVAAFSARPSSASLTLLPLRARAPRLSPLSRSDNLAVCDSWIGVIWDYIMRDEIGPYNRVKRPAPKDMDLKKID